MKVSRGVSYPDDYEAQVFYALTLQAAASHADTTYADQLKSAAILEKRSLARSACISLLRA